jgi:hypothetical protein
MKRAPYDCFKRPVSFTRLERKARYRLSFCMDLQMLTLFLQKISRTCSRFSRNDSHEVPFSWGLHCNHCHRSTCFEHILNQFKLHSAEAILLFDMDGTRMKYHQNHMLSSTRYGNNLSDVEKSQKDGSSTDGRLLLVHITSKYGHCFPLNSKSLQHGWYDPVQQEEVSTKS